MEDGAGTGVERLSARVREMVKPSATYERPTTLEETAAVIADLNERVNRLEAFANKPAVALASAVVLAIAAKLAGAV